MDEGPNVLTVLPPSLPLSLSTHFSSCTAALGVWYVRESKETLTTAPTTALFPQCFPSPLPPPFEPSTATPLTRHLTVFVGHCVNRRPR